MFKRLTVGTLTLGGSLAMAGAHYGCSSPGDAGTVPASAEAVNRTSQALTSGVLEWVNGTYGAGCHINPGGSWSLQVTNPSMDHTALSVAMNDTGCALTITELVTTESSKTTYNTASGILLSGGYAATASQFTSSADGGGGPMLYANAVMSPSNFSAAFIVTIEYSDDPALLTGSVTGTYATVVASSTPSSITSPNNTLSLATTFTTDVNFVIQTATGNATLSSLADGGTVYTGGYYYVDQGTLTGGPTFTFAQLDNAWNADGGATKVAMTPPTTTILPAAFNLVGVTAPVYRTIVIQRLQNGVASYETFYITFTQP